MYRGREALNNEYNQAQRIEIQKIPSLMSGLVKGSPGVCHLRRINQSFLCVKAFVVGAMQTLFDVDCTHPESPLNFGVQLHQIGRDGNLKTLKITVPLVLSEGGDNYYWFF